MKLVIKTIYLLGIVLVGFLATVLVFSAFPLPGNYKFLVVLSGSMEPGIKLGSLVLVKPMADYQVGEVITYKNSKDPAKSTTHRMVEKLANGKVLVKGDANKDPDSEPVLVEDILGKVLFTLPYLGYLVVAVKKPVGFFFLILLPATIIIYDELKKIKNEIKKMRVKEALFLLFILSVALLETRLTTAFFADKEESLANVFSAAASFGQSSSLYVSPGHTCPGGATETSDKRGNVTIDIGQNNLFLKVGLEGALANTSYEIWVNQDPGSCPLASPSFWGEDALTTDGSGNANKSYTIGKFPGATKYWISAVGGGQVLRSLAMP